MGMRWSELAEKELIDLVNGERLGLMGEADLVVDPSSGRVKSLVLSGGGTLFRKKREEITIDWGTIRKIGPEMVIVALGKTGSSRW
jgi:YlmC/YmxH family sporulation protein